MLLFTEIVFIMVLLYTRFPQKSTALLIFFREKNDLYPFPPQKKESTFIKHKSPLFPSVGNFSYPNPQERTNEVKRLTYVRQILFFVLPYYLFDACFSEEAVIYLRKTQALSWNTIQERNSKTLHRRLIYVYAKHPGISFH